MGFFDSIFGKSKSETKQDVIKITKQHVETLSNKRKVLWTCDDYGNYDDGEKWNKEIRYFLHSNNILNFDNYRNDMDFIMDILHTIDNIIDRYEEQEMEESRKELDEIPEKLKEKYLSTIMENIDVLFRKQLQLVTMDEYGEYDFSGFDKEMEYYIDKKFGIDLMSDYEISSLKIIILEAIEEYSDSQQENEIEFNEYMSPTDYEHFCKDILLLQGFDARVTQQSGDQGVDVIIYADNEPLIAIQCKMYSSPVGNKAVQEVYAAKEHIGASMAIVVTNNTYTKSAHELSNTTGVLLLHHDDLRTLMDDLTNNEY